MQGGKKFAWEDRKHLTMMGGALMDYQRWWWIIFLSAGTVNGLTWWASERWWIMDVKQKKKRSLLVELVETGSEKFKSISSWWRIQSQSAGEIERWWHIDRAAEEMMMNYRRARTLVKCWGSDGELLFWIVKIFARFFWKKQFSSHGANEGEALMKNVWGEELGIEYFSSES
jgi:hypothetical protein